MRQMAGKIALSMLGTPYRWGGDDPMGGFDCSGFVIELLMSVGLVPERFDTTADGLWKMYRDREVDQPRDGCLVFYGRDSYASHVEYCINGLLSIGASGGSSRTRTLLDAIDQNAYIKIRPINHRKDIVGYADPFLPKPRPDGD